MTVEEKKDMIEKLIGEGMTEEQAEQAVADTEQVEGERDDEQAPVEDVVADEGVEAPVEESGDEDQPDGAGDEGTFPREYVEKLRRESAGYREKAKDRDTLAQRLQVALVAADGRLADPEDLPFDEAYLEDPEALAAAITELISKKPGLRAQQVRGDVGQGKRGSGPAPQADLISIIKGM